MLDSLKAGLVGADWCLIVFFRAAVRWGLQQGCMWSGGTSVDATPEESNVAGSHWSAEPKVTAVMHWLAESWPPELTCEGSHRSLSCGQLFFGSLIIFSMRKQPACFSHFLSASSSSLFFPLCPPPPTPTPPSLPLSPPPALHQPTPAIFTPHTSVAALIQPQTAAGSTAKQIIRQQSTSPSPSLPLPLSMHSSSRGSSEAEGPRLSTGQALYWGVYGALCCQCRPCPRRHQSSSAPGLLSLPRQPANHSLPGSYRRWEEK